MTVTTLSDDAKLVSEPVKFHNSGLVAPNRTLKSAMTERLCDWPDEDDGKGRPNAQYVKLYEEWGKAGLGVIVTGNFMADRRYPEAAGNPVIDKTSTWDPVEAFRPVFAAAKAAGSLILVQISHGGRQSPSNLCPNPVSASDVQNFGFADRGLGFNKPRPMTIEEIEDLVDRVAFTAKAVYDAGANGIQLHAAHGYLLSQFCSPVTNLRTDRYGGSLENRTRLMFEMFSAIRARVPDKAFLLSIKINSADFTDGGFSEDESRTTIMKLEEAGLDIIELSGGTFESWAKLGIFIPRPSTVKREAFFLEFAERIRPHLTTSKLCVTGGFRSVAGMARAVREGACDIVGVARPVSAELDFPNALLVGERDAARLNKLDSDLSTTASMVQIKEIANGLPISDFSDDEVVKRFQEGLGSDSVSPEDEKRLRTGGHKVAKAA